MKPSLFKSRKFWILVADAFFSSLSALLGILLAPDKLPVILGFVTTWQPVAYAVIRGITEEDAAVIVAKSVQGDL